MKRKRNSDISNSSQNDEKSVGGDSSTSESTAIPISASSSAVYKNNPTTPLRLSNGAKYTLIKCDSEMTQISSAPFCSSAEIQVQTASAATQLKFETKPKTVLLIKQWKNDVATRTLLEIAAFLKSEHQVQSVIEPSAKQEIPSLEVFSEKDEIDFCVVIGGDGTLLHLNSLFQEKRSVPPVLPLAQGSLGFMMPYSCEQFKKHLTTIFTPNLPINITMRTRLICEYYKSGEIAPSAAYQVLNELLIYRGISPYLTKLEFFVNEALVTTIQADGVVVSTPSGSTAYSLSAGGSLMPPDVPAILLTPACPHSLSFRPLVLPDSCVLKLRSSKDARASVQATWDGRSQISLDIGDYIVVKTSPWAVPTDRKSVV